MRDLYRAHPKNLCFGQSFSFMKTRIPQIAAAVIVLLLLVFAIVQFSAHPQEAIPPAQTATTTLIDTAASPTTTPKTPQVMLSVDGKTYAASVPASRSVLDAMRAMQASGLMFVGTEYPSLGFFIESINGKKAADGYNWMLYVNGAQSQTGASQTKISGGDRIEWKYEK